MIQGEYVRATGESIPFSQLAPPIDGNPEGKNLLSMFQLSPDDLADYIDETRVAEEIRRDFARRGIDLLPFVIVKNVMRQPSTRTGGSMETAADSIGATGSLYSGMHSSSEAKGEAEEHTWVAFATQAHIIGLRTANEDGPYIAAGAIDEAYVYDKLWRKSPVINLGNGTDEHTTQGIGDAATIVKWLGGWDADKVRGKVVVMVGDHERYRATHSQAIAAKLLGMHVVAVESEVAPMPDYLIDYLGPQLSRTYDLDEAIREADVLSLCRNPDEFTGDDPWEQLRSRWLADSYDKWLVDNKRLQQMKQNGIVIHPRPINLNRELTRDVEYDPRMKDVDQMDVVVSGRLAVIARHMGSSIVEAVEGELNSLPELALV